MIHYSPVIQPIVLDQDHKLDVLRLDLVDLEISGNKWFKLKKNIESANSQGKKKLVTVGGAFSNHIAATAAACSSLGLKSYGIIRGEETNPLNPTLLKAQQDGMELHFVTREEYRKKSEADLKKYLFDSIDDFYFIPEGGNNVNGVLGCQDIIMPEWNYDYIILPVGTGTTYAGILASVQSSTKVIGISVLKGENTLTHVVTDLMQKSFPEREVKIFGNEVLAKATIESSCIINTYNLGGYAKYSQPLTNFKKQFEKKHTVELDYIYTSKMMFATIDLLEKKKIPSQAKILAIHTGGLQGNRGFEERYKISE